MAIPTITRRLTVNNPSPSVTPDHEKPTDWQEQEEKIKKLQEEYRETGEMPAVVTSTSKEKE